MQYNALLLLSSEEGWRLTDLSERLICERSTVTRLVDYFDGWTRQTRMRNCLASERMLLLVLRLPITFAGRDEGSDPPQQFGHHSIEGPVEKGSPWRIRRVRDVRHHIRDQRDANLLTDGNHFEFDQNLAQLLRCSISRGEATVISVHDLPGGECHGNRSITWKDSWI